MAFFGIMFGSLMLYVFLKNLYNIYRCKVKLYGVCYQAPSQSYKGVRTYTPVFDFHYNDRDYRVKASQETADPLLIAEGEVYEIYIDPENPKRLIWKRYLSPGQFFILILALIFLYFGFINL